MNLYRSTRAIPIPTNTTHRWPLLLLLLLAADFVFMGLHLAFVLNLTDNWLYSLEQDRSYSELYQYIKAFWAVLLFGAITFKKRQLVYATATLLFAYVLLDDALRFHEDGGRSFIAWFDLQPAFGLRSKDFGELCVLSIAGTTILFFLAMSYRLGNAEARKVCKHLMYCCIAFAFCAIAVDMFSIIIDEHEWALAPLTLLEDGGEMVIVSVMVWYSYSLLNRILGQPGASDRMPENPA